jgi:hypothetical protein
MATAFDFDSFWKELFDPASKYFARLHERSSEQPGHGPALQCPLRWKSVERIAVIPGGDFRRLTHSEDVQQQEQATGEYSCA